MTHQEFKSRYQLLKKVSDGRLSTYHALAANGAVVMVHMLEAGATDEYEDAIARINRLGPEDRARVLTIDDVEGAPLIVTRFLLDYGDLTEWLAARAPDSTPDAPFTVESPAEERFDAPPPPAAPPSPQPIEPHAGDTPPRTEPIAAGEFTAMFGRPLGEPSPPPTEMPPDAAGQRGASEIGGGEFTRMFRAAETPPPGTGPGPERSGESPEPSATADTAGAADAEAAENEPPAIPSEAPPSSSVSGPGEFTGVFGGQPATPPPAGPGEFTGVFGAQPPTPPPAGPGEFTSVFGAQSPPSPTAVPSEFARGGSAAQPAPPTNDRPASSVPPHSASGPEGRVPPRTPASGPGEFTRVFGAPERPAPPDPWAGGQRTQSPSPASPDSDDYLRRLGASSPQRAPVHRDERTPTQGTTPAPSNWNLDLPKPPAPPMQSEFTRVISTPNRPAAAQLPAGMAQAPAAPTNAKPPSRTRLIVGLSLIALVAVVAIVLLVVLAR